MSKLQSGIMKRSVASPDFLSDLPEDIIAKILGRLPILDAIRTSFLSRQWRYRWYSITDLVFENLDSMRSDIPVNERARFIDRVLLPLRGPVHKFLVGGNTLVPSHFDLNQWLLCLSRRGIAELYLNYSFPFEAPSTLFQCIKLTHLELSSCKRLKLPFDFKGFEYLKTLIFVRVNISVTCLEKLISGCPLLEYLSLRNSHTKLLKIHAPLLKYLYLEGVFDGFVLEKAGLLTELTVRIEGDIANQSNVLVKFQDQVPSLKKLSGQLYFTKYCSAGATGSLARDVLHNHLQSIKLAVNFEDRKQVDFLLQLLCCSPVIKEIQISALNRGNLAEAPLRVEFWNKPCYIGCKLSLLMEATMIYESGSVNEIRFMHFLLLKSPALKKMIVTSAFRVSDECKMKILVALVRCPRASNQGQVVFLSNK